MGGVVFVGGLRVGGVDCWWSSSLVMSSLSVNFSVRAFFSLYLSRARLIMETPSTLNSLGGVFLD